MARRRMSALQRKYFGGRKKSRSRRSSGFFGGRKSKGGSDNIMQIAIGGAAYGALREPVWNAVGKYIPQFAGQWTDEATMLAASYLLAKKTSGIPRSIGKAGIYIETARLGAGLIGGVLGGSNGNIQQSTTGVVYG